MPIGGIAHPMAAFSGFFESHEPPPSSDACSILPAHRDGHQKDSKIGVLCIIVLLIVVLAAARRQANT
jgi:hypothetical protein